MQGGIGHTGRAVVIALAGLIGCGGGGSGDGPGDGDAPLVDGGPPDAFVDPCTDATVRCYYLAPDGDDGAAGTIAAPWFSLERAWQVVDAGDVIYLRGGTYALRTKPVLLGRSGEAGRTIKIWNYPGETPVLTPGPDYVLEEYVGLFFTGDYVHWRGLELTGFVNVDGFVARALRVEASSHNVFERLHMHHNGSGLLIQAGDGGGPNSDDNLVLNSDFHHHQDPVTGYGNADGIGLNFIDAGAHNTIRGCRAWANSDDGFDVFANAGAVLIENCWSWNNGYIPDTNTPGGDGEGFKLGIVYDAGDQVLRTVLGSVAVANRLSGFHQEEGDCRMELTNNTAYANLDAGFNFNYLDRAHRLHNNVAYANELNGGLAGPATTSSHNAWGGPGESTDGWADIVNDADFVSLDVSELEAPRQADGSLPEISLLHLAADSDLVDAGLDVGQPFAGVAPDVGAFER